MSRNNNNGFINKNNSINICKKDESKTTFIENKSGTKLLTNILNKVVSILYSQQ